MEQAARSGSRRGLPPRDGLTRASESDRGVICPASLILPKIREKPQKTIEAADFGTLVHHWKETGETDPPWASERDIVCLEKKLLASGVQRETWWEPGHGHHEVSFAINLKTLWWCEYGGARGGADKWKASFGPQWLTGTIDWLGWAYKPEYPWVDDLKTGRWPVKTDSKQLLSYMLLPWLRAGRPRDWAGVCSITQWPKYPLHGLPDRRYRYNSKGTTLVLPVHMEEHVDDLRYSLEHPTETNPTEEGCRFCDCRPVCPAHAGE